MCSDRSGDDASQEAEIRRTARQRAASKDTKSWWQ